MPSSNEICCELLIAILLPPLAVCLKHGYYSVEFCKCLLLTILGYVPGIIYAIYTIVFVNQDEYKIPLYYPSNQSSGTKCNQVEAASVGADKGNWKSLKGKDGDGVNTTGRDDSSMPTQSRFVWTDELHRKFVAAVNILGDKAVPKKILELMDVPGLTRSKVASHLRKYRMYLQCQSGESPPTPSNLNNSFMYQPTFGPVSSVKVLDLQELAANDQPPEAITIEHLITHLTTVESHPIGNIHAQSSRTNSPLMQMCQPQLRRQIPNGIGANVYTRNGMQENIRSHGYNPVPQTSSMPNFPHESNSGTTW